MKTRLALTLAGVAAVCAIPGSARAQMLYLASQSAGTAPTYTGWTSFTTKSGTSTNGDTGMATLPIPFTFVFYGKPYTSVDVSADGFLVFETGYCTGSGNCQTNANIPKTSMPNGFIAFWWDDGYFETQSGKWVVSGAPGSQIFSIQLSNWGTYDYDWWTYQDVALSPRTVQIDLHEDSGAIEIYYGAISTPHSYEGEAVVGIEDATGANGLVGLSCSAGSSRCDNADWPANQKVTFAPAIDPDLLVSEITGSPLTPITLGGKAGYQVDVTIKVRNQGQNDATGFVYDLYLCNQSTVVTNDPAKCQLLRSHTSLESLVGHQTTTFLEAGLQFEKPASGVFYLGVYVDPPTATAPKGAVSESLETNNAAVSMGYEIGADLAGTITGATNAGPGEDARVEVTLRNRGTEPVTTPFQYDVWLGATATLNKSTDTRIHTGDVAALGGGETQVLKPAAKLPTTLADGQYYFHLVIDAANVVAELNESNNAAYASTPVTVSGSDLLVQGVVVKSPTPPNAVTTEAFFGEKLRVEFTIANKGGGTATDFYACIMLSDTPVISLFDIDITPVTAPLSNLTYLGGETHTYDVDVTVPLEKSPGVPLADGPYYVGVIADCRSTVPESSKANNKASTTKSVYIRQPAADYMPAELQSPAAGAAGEVMPVYRVLRNLGNRGNLDASAPVLKYQYYLSSNDIISPEDIPLSILDAQGAAQEYGQARLGPGDVSRATDHVVVPANVSPGTYYVGLIADPGSEHSELDELNNDLGSLGTVEIVANSLRVATGSLPDALVGVTYLQQLVADGAEGVEVWSVAPGQGELPPGLSLSAQGVLEGMPAAAGGFVFTVRVQSGSREALARLAMRVVLPTGALQVLSGRLPTAVRGQAYSVNLSAVGGVRPYTWLLSSGVLPEGLALDPTGRLVGKLTRAYGNVTFAVSVTDAFGTRVVSELSLRAVEPGTLFVATTTLQKATVGATFRQQLQAAGGTAPFTWAISGGALPDGLRLTGDSILGNPTKVGYFAVIVQVSDSAGFSDEGAFILTVLPRPAAFAMPKLPELKPEDEFSINLSLQAKPHSTFALFSGRLPPGISLLADGHLGGKVAADAAPGSYDALLLVREESGAEALVPLTLRVLPKPWVPSTSTGGGCASGGGGSLPTALGLLALLPLALRRRRAGLCAALVAAGLAVPGAARADYDVRLPVTKAFEPLAGGTAVSLDATGQAAVALPFAFKVYNDAFTTLNVGCRGYLAFNGGSATKAPSLGIPTTAAAYPIVAPWWGSWECLPGALTYGISGVAPQRVVTFQWDRVWYTPDTSGKSSHGATFQARLFETSNRVEFAYGPSYMAQYEPPDLDKAPKAAVGIQNVGGKVGVAGLSCTTKQPSGTAPGDAGVAALTGAQCGVADYTAGQVISLAPLPDLAITRIYADDEGYAGSPMRMGTTVLNQGGELASVSVTFYLSKDNALDVNTDTLLGSTKAMDVDVQQRRDVLVSLKLPDAIAGASFYLFAMVDADLQVNEDNETNNKSTGLLVALGSPKPDLAVGEVLVDKATARAGEALLVTRTLKNQGNALSGPCSAPAQCGAGRTCDAGRCRQTCAGPEQCAVGLTCTRGICDTPACTSSDVCLAGETCNAGVCVARPVSYAIYLSENPVVTLADRQLFPVVGVAHLASGIPAFGEETSVEHVSLPSDLSVGQYYVGVIVNPEADLPEILVVNNSGASATPLTVVSDTLTLQGAALPDAQAGAPYSVRLGAGGGDGAYAFTLGAGSTLPAGLALSASGDVAGVPLSPSDAVAFDVQVASAGKTATGRFTVKVVPANLPLTLVTQDVPAAEFGKVYKASLSAVGGRPPYRWSLAAGAELPPGMALGQDGTLEGVPAKDGAFAFGVEVLDAKGSMASAGLSFVVVAPDRLTIATQGLADAYLGKSYTAPLQAVGGKPPYAWTVVEVQQVPVDPTDTAKPSTTRLPEPLQVVTDKNGTRIEGKPTIVGTFIVTLKVVDLSGAEDNASYVLNIRYERGVQIVTVGLPDAIAGKAYAATLATGEGDPAAVKWSVTCTPRYDATGALQPCLQQPPPGIALAADGTLSTAVVTACNEPEEEPKGCPEGLSCASDGSCVLSQPEPDPDTGSIPARSIYSFLVRAEETKSGRFAIKALSITVRVDEPPPQPPASGCSSGAGALALWPAALAALALLRRRRGGGVLAAVLLLAAGPLASCGQPKKPEPVTRCDDVVCAAGLSCDPGDGVCKCGGEGGTICATGGVCTGGVCVYSCGGIVCDRGTTLDPLDCQCKCGTQVCLANESCDTGTRTCYVASRCVGVACGGGMSCDPADGVCKCGGASCAGGEVCVAGQCTSEPCAGVSCTGGALCDPADGVCKCGGSSGRLCTYGELCACPSGASCKDEDRRCTTSAKCAGVACSGGTTCDPADGLCRCGGPGGPICQAGQSCDVLRKACLGGDRCAGVTCGASLNCDPEDGVCKCGGQDGVNGEVCEAGEVCGHFNDVVRCVTPCDPRTQKCAGTGQACYFDIYARVSYCAVAGKNIEGAGCRVATDCGKGLHCQQFPGETGNCRRYCNVPDGASGCPQTVEAQDCYQLDGADHDVGSCDSMN